MHACLNNEPLKLTVSDSVWILSAEHRETMGQQTLKLTKGKLNIKQAAQLMAIRGPQRNVLTTALCSPLQLGELMRCICAESESGPVRCGGE
jgi:hypothetical protein